MHWERDDDGNYMSTPVYIMSGGVGEVKYPEGHTHSWERIGKGSPTADSLKVGAVMENCRVCGGSRMYIPASEEADKMFNHAKKEDANAT